jgi:hypothetical protein
MRDVTEAQVEPQADPHADPRGAAA